MLLQNNKFDELGTLAMFKSMEYNTAMNKIVLHEIRELILEDDADLTVRAHKYNSGVVQQTTQSLEYNGTLATIVDRRLPKPVQKICERGEWTAPKNQKGSTSEN